MTAKETLILAVVLLIFALTGGCVMGESMKLESDAFSEGGYIPAKYTCKGEDVSPPLKWSGTPKGCVSFALIVEDPDAPMGTWDHWVAYDIPGDKNSLDEGVPTEKSLPDGYRQGINDFRKIGYGGPCPPPGKPHRYVFTLYALDAKLGLDAGLNKGAVLKAIKGHILGKAVLTGLFKR